MKKKTIKFIEINIPPLRINCSNLKKKNHFYFLNDKSKLLLDSYYSTVGSLEE